MNAFANQALGLSTEDGDVTDTIDTAVVDGNSGNLFIIENEIQNDNETLRLLSSATNTVCNLTTTAEELADKAVEVSLSPETVTIIANQMETIMSDLGISREVAEENGMAFSTEDSETSESTLKRMKDFVIRLFKGIARTFGNLWERFNDWLYESFGTYPRLKARIKSLSAKGLKEYASDRAMASHDTLVELIKLKGMANRLMTKYAPAIKTMFGSLQDVGRSISLTKEEKKDGGTVITYELFQPALNVVDDIFQLSDGSDKWGEAFGHRFVWSESYSKMKLSTGKILGSEQSGKTDTAILAAISASIPEFTMFGKKRYTIEKFTPTRKDFDAICDSMISTIDKIVAAKGLLSDLKAVSTKARDTLDRGLADVEKNSTLIEKGKVSLYKVYLNFFNKPWNRPLIQMASLVRYALNGITSMLEHQTESKATA